MALSDSPVKSIGLLVGIAMIGAIFIVATSTLRNNQSNKQVVVTSKPYSEPTSGVVFDAPAEWSVGISTGNLLIARGIRIDEIQSQRGSCSNFSKSGSSSLAQAVLNGDTDAITEWQRHLPGLVGTQLLTSNGGKTALIGIDTCAQSLNQRLLTLRGQVYQNDVEVRFSTEIKLSSSLSQAQVEEQAKALARGTSTTNQATYNQFVGMMRSLR